MHNTALQERAAGIIAKAEADLRSLLQEVAGSASYADIIWLSHLAERISALKPQPESPPNDKGLPPPPPPTAAAPRPKKGAYPRFRTEGEDLIKTGWSKKNREEYEHRAPRRIFELVQGYVRRAGAGGQTFRVDAFMPVPDPEANRNIPDYQVYLCIAYLIAQGVLQRSGKGEYRLC